MKINSNPAEQVRQNDLRQNELRQNNVQQNNLMKQLASAKRVNSAADDAAGLQIIDRLTSEANSASQGMRNLYDGMSLANVAEQALGGFSDGLAELERLTVQAGNGALSTADREAIAEQADQVSKSMQQQISDTTFGGIKLFDQNKQIAFSGGESLVSVKTPGLENAVAANGLDAIDFNSEAGRSAAQNSIRSLAKEVNASRAELGAGINTFAAAARGLANQNENVAAARSRIEDLDYASAVSQQVAAGIREQATVAVTMQGRISAEQSLKLLA
jgi:flagellin